MRYHKCEASFPHRPISVTWHNSIVICSVFFLLAAPPVVSQYQPSLALVSVFRACADAGGRQKRGSEKALGWLKRLRAEVPSYRTRQRKCASDLTCSFLAPY